MTSLEWRKQETRDIVDRGGMVGEQQVTAGVLLHLHSRKNTDLGDVEFSC